MTEITAVTAFATIFSILSITLSVFEHISASVLLSSETVLIIKINVRSDEMSRMTISQFKKVENLRNNITSEISKIIDMDRRLIELLRPIQTKSGCYLTFHIRSDASIATTIMDLIRREAKNGELARVEHNTCILPCNCHENEYCTYVCVCLFIMFCSFYNRHFMNVGKRLV